MRHSASTWQTSLLAASLVLAAGCGDKKEDEAAAAVVDQIAGTWQSACLQQGTATTYERKDVKFTRETFAFTSSTYSDAACTTVVDVIAGSGTFLVSGTTAKEGVGELNNLDYTFSTYTWTFRATPADAVNYAKDCGGTNVNGTVNILNATCKFSETAQVAFHSPSYGTLMLENDTLLITDFDTNGAAADSRASGVTTGLKLGWTKIADAAP